MSLRTWIATMGLAAVTACGTVKGDDAMGDDMPPVDTTPPQLVSSTPGDNSTRVPVTTTLRFMFDEDLDPASVAAASVSVDPVTSAPVGLPSQRINGTTTYEAATRTAVVTLSLPLAHDARYEVTFGDGIKDVAGNAFTATTFTFHTYVNNPRIQVGFTSNGTPSYYYRITLDAQGRMTKQIYISGPGTNGIWMDSDDVASGVSTFIYDAAGNQTQRRTFDRGPDNLLNTGDDIISSLYLTTYDAKNRMIEQTGATGTSAAGPDNQWGTADDILSSITKFEYGPDGLARQIRYGNAGPDNIWKTADDRVSYYYDFTYDSSGNRTRFVSTTPGPDMIGMTSDDTINYWAVFEYDATGAATRRADYYDKGPDLIWMTSDDPIGYLQLITRDERGNDVSTRDYYDPGPDGMWNTMDDEGSPPVVKTFDPVTGLVTREEYLSNAGPDMMWGTADDVLSGHQDTVYNPDGNRVSYGYYNGPGPDNVWRTGDDRMAYEYQYDTAN